MEVWFPTKLWSCQQALSWRQNQGFAALPLCLCVCEDSRVLDIFTYINTHITFSVIWWKIWPPGSLEERVQNLVKTWEMELFHKTSDADYKSFDSSNYTFSLNGKFFFSIEQQHCGAGNLYLTRSWWINCNSHHFAGRKGISLAEKRKLGGGYNYLLQTSLPTEFLCHNPAEEAVDSSHRAFTTAFPRGFAVEILHVYSGPPEIVYKFRHWGYMEGPFKGHAPTGELVELFGMAVFKVNVLEFFLNLS